MSTYVYGCRWNGKELEIEAATLYAAQQKAVVEFKKVAGRKKVRDYEVHVMLLSKDGEPYVHVPTF